MAFELHAGIVIPGVAASNITSGVPVAFASSAAQDRAVVPVGSLNALPVGVALATAGPTSSLPNAVTVHGIGNIVKALAAASIGVGADVAVGSTNGVLVGAAGASGVVKYALGQSVTPANPGEYFSVYVNPRILSGNP